MECPEIIKVQPVLKSFSGEGAFKRNFIPYKPTIVQSKPFNRAAPLMVSVPSKRCAISSSWKLKKQLEVSTQKRGVLSRKGMGNVEVSLLILDSKNAKEIESLSPLVHEWIRCEYFYSYIDKPYFCENSFTNIISKLKLDRPIEEISSNEWRAVRKSMGKIRRFSPKFVSQERAQLLEYRNAMKPLLKLPVIV